MHFNELTTFNENAFPPVKTLLARCGFHLALIIAHKWMKARCRRRLLTFIYYEREKIWQASHISCVKNDSDDCETTVEKFMWCLRFFLLFYSEKKKNFHSAADFPGGTWRNQGFYRISMSCDVTFYNDHKFLALSKALIFLWVWKTETISSSFLSTLKLSYRIVNNT